MTTKTVKNTETKTTTAKATAEKSADKPKATTKAKAKPEEAKEVQTSEPTETKAEETTAVASATTTAPDVYSKEFVKEATKYKNKIRLEYGKVESSFLNIAFALHWIYDNKGYKPLGYDNIYDFAKKEFDIARGTTCNFINVVERFGERDELGNFTGNVAPQYEAYSSSKLILMLSLKDEEIQQLSPSDSVRELKKKIAFLVDKGTNGTQIEEKEASDGFSQTQTYERQAEEEETFKITRQALIVCQGQLDYQSKLDKIDDYILLAFKAHPDCRIEIVCVTAEEQTSVVEEEENED